MAVHTQRWAPDTCGCILLETWDDAVPDAARVHTFHATDKMCPVHAGTADEALYAVIRGENRRKNLVAVIAKSVRADFVDADYTWAFDAQRRVLVTIADLTSAQKTTLQAAVDLQFGRDVVIIL